MGVGDRVNALLDKTRTTLEHGDGVLGLLPRLIERGVTLMDEGSLLMKRGASLMDRSERALDRSDRALDTATALMEAATLFLRHASDNATLERRRLELEIARLERG
jgi:hypothetical protein